MKIESNRGRNRDLLQSALRGHSIMFDHDAPSIATSMLDSKLMNEHFCLHFVGPKGESDWLYQKTMEGASPHIFARPFVIYQWLTILQKINPLYHNDQELMTYSELKATVDQSNNDLLQNALTTYNDELENIETIEKDDVAGIRQSSNPEHYLRYKDIEENKEVNLATIKYSYVTSNTKTRHDQDCNHTQEFLKEVAKTLGLDVDGENAIYEKTMSHRSQYPVSEFGTGDYPLVAAFPDVFLFGKSFEKPKPNLNEQERIHLLMQFTTNAAKNKHLIFYLFDKLQRHSNIQGIHTKINHDPRAFAKFVKTFFSNEFQVKLKNSISDPNGKDAKQVV